MTAPLSDDDMALVAEHVLGLLPPDEALRLEARLASDPALRAEYRAWTERMAALLADVPEVAAPAPVRAAVMTRLFAAPATQRGRGWRRWFWPGLLAGTALAGLLLVLVLPVPGPRAPAYQATLGADGAAVRLIAAYDDRSGDLVLSGIVGRPAAGRDFELWLIPAGQPPVSLGVLPATTTASVTVPAALRAALAAGALAVSDEPAGGSPTGLPTGAVLATALLRGPVTGS